VCPGLLFYGWYFGFLGVFSSWFNNFWFIGHQTMDKIQKYSYTNANTPSSETYRNDDFFIVLFHLCWLKELPSQAHIDKKLASWD
jgi:hypothetical protein